MGPMVAVLAARLELAGTVVTTVDGVDGIEGVLANNVDDESRFSNTFCISAPVMSLI